MLSMIDADRYFQSLGAVKVAESGTFKKTWSGDVFEVLFAHYFDKDGGEVGYVTVPLLREGYYRNVFPNTFSPSRQWAPSFISDLLNWRVL